MPESVGEVADEEGNLLPLFTFLSVGEIPSVSKSRNCCLDWLVKRVHALSWVGLISSRTSRMEGNDTFSRPLRGLDEHTWSLWLLSSQANSRLKAE